MKLDEIEQAIARGLTQPSIRVQHIFIVGIEKYLYLPSVPRANKDAKDLSVVLSDSVQSEQGELVVLTDEKATCSVIREHLKNVASSSSIEQDSIIIFLCHTIRRSNRNYLCAYETDPNNLEDTAIEGQELASLIREIPTRNSIILLDCQHSLEVAPDDKIFAALEPFAPGLYSTYLDYLTSSTGAQVLTSSSGGERIN